MTAGGDGGLFWPVCRDLQMWSRCHVFHQPSSCLPKSGAVPSDVEGHKPRPLILLGILVMLRGVTLQKAAGRTISPPHVHGRLNGILRACPACKQCLFYAFLVLSRLGDCSSCFCCLPAPASMHMDMIGAGLCEFYQSMIISLCLKHDV